MTRRQNRRGMARRLRSSRLVTILDAAHDAHLERTNERRAIPTTASLAAELGVQSRRAISAGELPATRRCGRWVILGGCNHPTIGGSRCSTTVTAGGRRERPQEPVGDMSSAGAKAAGTAPVPSRERDAELYDAEVERRRQLGAIALTTLEAGAETLDNYGRHASRRCTWRIWLRAPKSCTPRSTQAPRAFLGDVALRHISPAPIAAWQAGRLKARSEPRASVKHMRCSAGSFSVPSRTGGSDKPAADRPQAEVPSAR